MTAVSTVTDEAVEAGVAAFERVPEKQGAVDDTDGQFRDAMRAALVAAVPYLAPKVDRPMPTREQIEQRVRRIYIDGGAHVTHAQEAATEIAGAVLALLNGAE